MSDGEERHVFTVSELTGGIKDLLEARFTRIYVEAEIGEWRLYPSGHAYFKLKDEQAVISCVMFASALARCKAREGLRDGAKVLVYANATVYPPKGNYQLVVLAAKLAGEGDLMQKFLELKAKLEKEGLFDAARKRPLPFLPRRIGIVTSEAGAVIHDMCTVITRRFPAVEIRLYPALVQGAEAPATIIAGIEYFNRSPDWQPDLVIVARGGGSYEDLFCFNDEALVRAVTASAVPVISAVGHETDFTLCDFAADKRAGTPSIAAEIAVPVLDDLKRRLALCETRQTAALRSLGQFFAQRLDHLTDSLASSLTLAAGRALSRIDRAEARLEPAMRYAFAKAEARFEKACEKLPILSPYGVLDRGYALVTDARGAVLRDAAAAKPGDAVTVRLARGSLSAEVTGTAADSAS